MMCDDTSLHNQEEDTISKTDHISKIIQFTNYRGPVFWSLDWNMIEQRLGHPLPSDYKHLCDTIPPGRFTNFFWFPHPLGSDRAHLLSAEPEMRDTLRDLYEIWDEDEVPDFGNPDNLYPCLETDNGDAGYWVASSENPDQWTIAVNPVRSSDWLESDHSLSSLLHRHITEAPAGGPFSSAFTDETPFFQSAF